MVMYVEMDYIIKGWCIVSQTLCRHSDCEIWGNSREKSVPTVSSGTGRGFVHEKYGRNIWSCVAFDWRKHCYGEEPLNPENSKLISSPLTNPHTSRPLNPKFLFAGIIKPETLIWHRPRLSPTFHGN